MPIRLSILDFNRVIKSQTIKGLQRALTLHWFSVWFYGKKEEEELWMYIVWCMTAARTVVCSTPPLLFCWLSKSHDLKKIAAAPRTFAMGSIIFNFALPVLGRSKDVFHGTLRTVSRTGVTNVPLDWVELNWLFKAILQVLIYKALYDKSYLGSKTTMTSGEWICLISFATAPLTCSERGGSEKFKMKIYVSGGIRTHARQSTTGKLQRLRPLGHEGLMVISG